MRGGLLCALLMLTAFASSAEQLTSLPVPRPWNRVRVSGEQVQLTNTRITLGEGGLLDQVKVGSHPLLHRPLRVMAGGQVMSTVDRSSTQITDSGDRAEYTALLVATVRGQPLKIRLKAAIAFDGLTTFDLNADEWPAALRDVAISYQVPVESARFMHRWGPVGQRNVDLESAAPQALSIPYVPFVWLGNDERGLFWFAETSAGWVNAPQRDAIRLLKEGNHWNLAVTVKPRFSANGHWQHRFGFLPTPVKSLPPGWRRMRLYPAHGATAYVIWPNEKESAAPYFGYPASLNGRSMSTYLRNLQRAGIKGAPYACPTWSSTRTPEWQQNERDWKGGVADKPFEDSEWGGQFVNVCPAHASWKAFVRDRFGDFIRQFKLSALYMDNAQAYTIKGCLDPKEWPDVLEYPLLDQRELYRYVTAELHSQARTTFSIVHSSGGLNLPSFSMVDAWVNGEQYRGLVERDYLDVATLTDFRVELNAKQWGIVPIFLPEFPVEARRSTGPTRTLMSLLLLHDVRPWPMWANVQEINRALSMLDAFDVSEAEFVPYYASTPVARAGKAGVYVSGYRRRDETLVIAANLNKVKLEDRLCMADTTTFKTWPARETVEAAAGCISVEIRPGEYTMYLARSPDLPAAH